MAGPENRSQNLAEASISLATQIRAMLNTLGGDPIAPPIAPFLTEWPRAWQSRVRMGACTLPVLTWLAELASDERAFGRSVTAALCALSPCLAWQQSYAAGEVSATFLQNYGWTEILGSAGPLISERLACGFLVLGPHTRYPPHRHAAEELYVPLSGAARWQQGDATWRERLPGTLIKHASGEPHAMATDAQPLLALYLWRGDMTPSRLC